MEKSRYKLADVIESWTSGDWGEEIPSSECCNKVCCIRSADIVPIYNNSFEIATTRYISDKSFNKNLLKVGDIIVEKSGGTVNCSTGRVIYVNEEIFNNNTPLVCSNFCTAFRVKKEWDTLYIYYLLRYIHSTGLFMNYEGKTSGIHNLDINAAYSAIEIPDISLETQKRISSILATLDEKISLNTSINKNLEALAKKIYDYWFVQFDFPNEEGKPYKSSGGAMVWNEKIKREIPASWCVQPINDIADVINGATPSTKNENNYGGDIVWITPKDLSDQKHKFIYKGERNISKDGYDSCSTHLLPINSILMSSRAPIGLLAIAKAELCTNQGFKSFVPKEDRISTYLYYYLQFHIRQIEQLGTGTTFKEVSREDILKFPIQKPANDILDSFEAKVKAINEAQLNIQKENESLIKQRNELLPLLMNGQVTID